MEFIKKFLGITEKDSNKKFLLPFFYFLIIFILISIAINPSIFTSPLYLGLTLLQIFPVFLPNPIISALFIALSLQKITKGYIIGGIYLIGTFLLMIIGYATGIISSESPAGLILFTYPYYAVIILIIAPIIHFIGKGFHKIPLKFVRILILLIPIIILLVLNVISANTCAFGQNYSCNIKTTTQDAIKANDISLCNQTRPQYYEHMNNDCYYEMAQLNQDFNICQNIVGANNIFANCVKEVVDNLFALEKISIEDCDKLSSESLTDEKIKNICYTEIAILTLEPKVCSKASTPYYSNICYRNIAVKTTDLTICENIPDNEDGRQTAKDYCYLLIAKETGDLTICDSIQDTYRKNLCLEI